MELITKAYYLSGLVARDLEQVESSEGKDGLFWLNSVIRSQSMTGNQLPYYSHSTVNAVVGQQSYFFQGFVTSEAITFNIGDVRYNMTGQNRRKFWGEPRAENIQALPLEYYYERVKNGIQVYLYFLPADTYPLKMTGRTGLANVTEDTELDDSLDGFYQDYLMYLLADRLCQWKQQTLPPAVQTELNRYIKNVTDLNPKDLTLNKVSTLGRASFINYGQTNIGRGWTAG